MTIEKGELWGWPWDEPDGPAPPVLDGDAALAAQVLAGSGDHPDGSTGATGPPRFRLRGGDLLRTVGIEDERPSSGWHCYPVDVVRARLERDGHPPIETGFAAHLTVRDRPLAGLGPGLSVAVMNAAWLGELRLGPRAHPNDGIVDITEGTVGLSQRREANRRARSGSHLPHPGLRVTRTARWERRWDRPVPMWLDGIRRGRFHRIVVEVLPDAAVVVA